MSLAFGAAASDRVDCGSGSTLDDLDPFTILLWVYPTTLTNNRVIFIKGQSGNNSRKSLTIPVVTSNVSFTVDRATTDTSFITSGGIWVVNTWYLLAATFDSAASPVAHIYRGTLTAGATEPSYGTSTDGSGAVQSDAAENLRLGNSAANTVAFQGRIGYAAYIAGALTLAQIIDWQFRPRVIAGTRGFWIPGYNGTANVPDLSGNGNTGTITGATVADHVPLPAPFGRSDGWAPYVVASASRVRRLSLAGGMKNDLRGGFNG